VLCITGPGASRLSPEIARWISTSDGEELHRYDDAPLSMARSSGVHCGRIVDPIATSALEPGRYRIHALARSETFTSEARTTEFVVDGSGASDGGTPE